VIRRHVLLTGATGGLGQSLAYAYAAPNVRLHLFGRDTAKLAALAETCREQGASVTTVVVDVRDGQALCRHILAADEAWPVDTVIAAAGVSNAVASDGRAESLEDVRRVFAVNTLAAVETLSALAERLRRRGAGRLAIISSLGGYQGSSSSPSYSASKAAARVYGDALRGWLAPYGVTVTVVCPGFVDSPMSRRYQGNKPLLWDAAKAARMIRDGIEHGRPTVAFPWSLALGARLLGLLPARVVDTLQRRFFSFSVAPDAETVGSPTPQDH
jgi:short-subunit dehydrogenase